jgi:alkaline phosphatase D
MTDRRRFLAAAGGVAAAAAIAQLPADRSEATPRPANGDYPFTLGVASGDPTTTGVVLWTRLAPQPFAPDGGMPGRRVPVGWQIASDPRFRHIARSGHAWASPGLAHSVHVEVDGLAPDREWFYRFRYRHDTSPTGRTRTAPRTTDRLDLAFVSCQAWDNGYYPSYRHLARDDLDLILHLGDYVYEGGIPADGGFRAVPTPAVLREAPRDLTRWRMQYALYKSDPDLQDAHARCPWLVVWDDHEVQNDYANTQSQYEGDISALRAAAYQAWYEHQPVRSPAEAGRIYRRLRWGRLAQLDVVDGRQYRSIPPCGWGEADACADAYDPAVTMLGAEQERWLYEGFARSQARWNLLGSNVMLARLDHDGTAGDLLWHDAWDGFPAARNRLTRAWARHRVRNPVVLTGDWHSTFVNDIRRDFDRPDSPVVATEFVGTSISSNGDGEVYGPYYGPMIRFNPHIRFFDGDRRGYVRASLRREHLTAELRTVTTVSRPDAPESTFAAFVVADGRPGAEQL